VHVERCVSHRRDFLEEAERPGCRGRRRPYQDRHVAEDETFPAAGVERERTRSVCHLATIRDGPQPGWLSGRSPIQ
jgi:hypothetical protein